MPRPAPDGNPPEAVSAWLARVPWPREVKDAFAAVGFDRQCAVIRDLASRDRELIRDGEAVADALAQLAPASVEDVVDLFGGAVRSGRKPRRVAPAETCVAPDRVSAWPCGVCVGACVWAAPAKRGERKAREVEADAAPVG